MVFQMNVVESTPLSPLTPRVPRRQGGELRYLLPLALRQSSSSGLLSSGSSVEPNGHEQCDVAMLC